MLTSLSDLNHQRHRTVASNSEGFGFAAMCAMRATCLIWVRSSSSNFASSVNVKIASCLHYNQYQSFCLCI